MGKECEKCEIFTFVCIRKVEARLSIREKQKARRDFAEPVFPN